MEKVRHLEAGPRRIAADAERSKDLRTAILDLGELTHIVELLAKLRGELQPPQSVINVQVVAPMILDALQPCPEARQAVPDSHEQ